MSTHTAFPNESDAYRQAREKLLSAEMQLRRQVEEVAALRRALPEGHTIASDYEFDEIDPEGRSHHDPALRSLPPAG